MTDRLPPLAAEAMTEAQRAAADAFAAARGAPPFGPFVPLLRSPKLMPLVAQLGAYCRYENALGPRLTELVVLMVSRRYDQAVEWALHLPHARKAGIPEATIADLDAGRRPAAMTADETLVFDAVTELYARDGLSDATFAGLRDRFGEQGVVDLVATVGYYGLLALVLNVARTPAPSA
jgi:4-carboxymuconolactone decarboxylase